MTPERVLVVDVANVMGSRADGWWRDRPAAAARLVDQVRTVLTDREEVVLVVEGAARSGVEASNEGPVRVVHAPGHGDDAVVDEARDLVDAGRTVVVVTSDRELRDRVGALGATTHGPRWFLDLLA